MSEELAGVGCSDDERLERWRLVLGREADRSLDGSLDAARASMDRALEALYESDRKGGLGSSAPNVARWLGDIRSYFPSSTVRVVQRDAVERLNLRRLLLEPEFLEAVEPDVHLVGTLLSLSKVLPEAKKTSLAPT